MCFFLNFLTTVGGGAVWFTRAGSSLGLVVFEMSGLRERGQWLPIIIHTHVCHFLTPIRQALSSFVPCCVVSG